MYIVRHDMLILSHFQYACSFFYELYLDIQNRCDRYLKYSEELRWDSFT
jgi:hypothetical protein